MFTLGIGLEFAPSCLLTHVVTILWTGWIRRHAARHVTLYLDGLDGRKGKVLFLFVGLVAMLTLGFDIGHGNVAALVGRDFGQGLEHEGLACCSVTKGGGACSLAVLRVL